MNKYAIMFCVILCLTCGQSLCTMQFFDRVTWEPGTTALLTPGERHETLNAGFLGSGYGPQRLSSRSEMPEPVFLVFMGLGLISLAAAFRWALRHSELIS